MVGFQNFRRGVHFSCVSNSSSPQILPPAEEPVAYFKYEKQSSKSIVKYVCPDKNMYKVVEQGTPVYHEYSDILKEDGDFDYEDDWVIDR